MDSKAKNKYLRRLIYWRPVRNVMHTSRMLVLPGFQGIPLFDVVVFFIKGLTKGALNQRAAATSFHFVLAIFPLILFIFTLLPYFDLLCNSTLCPAQRDASCKHLSSHRGNSRRDSAPPTQRTALHRFYFLYICCLQRH